MRFLAQRLIFSYIGAIALHIKILWKPFHKQFGGVLDDFRKHRRNVERQASLSHMIEAAGEREAQSNERTRAQLQRATDNDIQKGMVFWLVFKEHYLYSFFGFFITMIPSIHDLERGGGGGGNKST